MDNEVPLQEVMEVDPSIQIATGSSLNEEVHFDYQSSDNYTDYVKGRYWCDEVYESQESTSLPFNLENEKNLKELIDNPEFNAKIDTPVDKSRDLGNERLEKITCPICEAVNVKKDPQKSAYFILSDPSKQIVDLIESNEDYFSEVTQRRTHEPGYMYDVYDGIKYREFYQSLEPKERYNYVTTVFNTDGASKFKCSKQSVWPLYLMINELPKDVRTNQLVVCGLMFTPRKPDMTIFLDKLVTLINDLRISCKIKNEIRLLRLYVLTCCVDAVARAPIQGIKQFNGHYGCNWCLHPGETHGVKRYPILKEVPKPRRHEEMVDLMLEADPDDPKFGVMYPSPLMNLPNFDLVEGFIPDYLHMALEGVAKQFTNHILLDLDRMDMDELDNKMLSIAIPQQISRRSRKISDRKDWKAREWENFVLYYSPVIFSDLLSPRKMQHWLLFVESLYTILLDKITFEDLNRADENLHTFVSEIESVYEDVRLMTFNVHQLLHVCTSVGNWGPVWSNSTFSFESANHYVLKSIKCAKNVSEQVMRYVKMCHNVSVLEKHICRTAENEVMRYCNDILRSKAQHVIVFNNILYFTPLKNENIVLNFREIEQCSAANFISSMKSGKKYLKIVKDDCLYESALLHKKMGLACAVVGCTNTAQNKPGFSFFRFPKVQNRVHKNYDNLRKLSLKRKETWIRCLKQGPLSEKELNYKRVCQEHFISGKPAKLEDEKHPDWAPCKNLGYTAGCALKKDAALDCHIRAAERAKKKCENEEETASEIIESDIVDEQIVSINEAMDLQMNEKLDDSIWNEKN
uniref:THAP-type domain-containing protein n=1 Tax=Trichogramma kaykai TaxID=54128 RepID=A0ABD2W9L0_9HYME